jgi:hypothetical protein
VSAGVLSYFVEETEFESQFQGETLTVDSRTGRVAGTMPGKRPRRRNIVADPFPIDFIGIDFHGEPAPPA